MDIIDTYIVPVVLIICLCVGYVLKNLVPTEKVNRYIPLVVATLGVVISVWNAGFVFTPTTVVTGLVSGLASTGMHQAFKSFMDKK